MLLTLVRHRRAQTTRHVFFLEKTLLTELKERWEATRFTSIVYCILIGYWSRWHVHLLLYCITDLLLTCSGRVQRYYLTSTACTGDASLFKCPVLVRVAGTFHDICLTFFFVRNDV